MKVFQSYFAALMIKVCVNWCQLILLQHMNTQLYDPLKLITVDARPWVEVGKATRRQGGAASGELRIFGHFE